MLFESPHVRIAAENGTATLSFAFPGEPANALDRAGLRELDAAIRFLQASRAVHIVVVRSAHSGGFCAGIRPSALASLTHPTDRAAFAWYAQQVADRLARLQAVTIALIDGPCLGAGFELALACDYRLCVASPGTIIGFPDGVACCGGSVRLQAWMGRGAEEFVRSGVVFSGREARALKLVDAAFCERRSRIELRSFLDRLELRPVKPGWRREYGGCAAERRAFAAAPAPPLKRSWQPSPNNPVPRFPETIGLLGDDVDAARLAADAALRGASVVVYGDRSLVLGGIEGGLARGFITPLEAEHARQRVKCMDSAKGICRVGLVLASAGQKSALTTTLLPRVIVAMIEGDRPDNDDRAQEWRSPARLRRSHRVVRVRFMPGERIHLTPTSAADADAPLTLASWLRTLGRNPVVLPPAELANSSGTAIVEPRMIAGIYSPG